MSMNTFRFSLVAVLGIAVLGSTFALTTRTGSDYAFFDPLIDVRGLITQRFVDEPDVDAMQMGAIRGMIESLNDPYTEYVPPRDRAEFQKNLMGEYVGIGALVQMERDGYLLIVTPLEDSPAAEAGVRAGDRVVEIEGETTLGKMADECVEMLVGEPGTEVSVLIDRDGQRIPMTITREKIVTRTVKGFVRRDEDQEDWHYFMDPERRIAYLRITQFTGSTFDEMRDALERVGAPEGELGGLVLDLRGNGGGLFSAAVQIADLLLEGGVIVATKGRAHEERSVSARRAGTLPEFPMAVLVNGQTASASEILAGSLVENDRAVVIGTRTFGKGRVQTVHELPSVPGAELKITEQRYYLPSGRLIDRLPDATEWGVDPSPGFFVPMTDEQFIEMLRTLRDREIINPDGEEQGSSEVSAGSEAWWSEPEGILEELNDPQLAAALEAVQGKVDTDTWPATGEENPLGTAVVSEELSNLELARERQLRTLARIEERIASLEASGAEADLGERDLWDDEIVVEGGRLRVFDAEGAPVAELRITGSALERWLIDAGVEPVEGEGEGEGEAEDPGGE